LPSSFIAKYDNLLFSILHNQYLKGFDTVIFCFCLTHAQHSILDMFFAKHSNWSSYLSDKNSEDRFEFVVKSIRNRLSHMFDIIPQNPKEEYLKIVVF